MAAFRIGPTACMKMKIPVAKSLGFYELAQNLYHVDVLYPQACSESIP